MSIKYDFPYGGEDLLSCDWKSINNVSERIIDDLSMRIYGDRVMLSLTKSDVFIRDLVMLTDVGRELYERMMTSGRLWIYGMGTRGKRIKEMFPEIRVKGYIDKKFGEKTEENGMVMLPLSMIMEDMDVNDNIIISNYFSFEKIKDELSKYIDKNNIITIGEYEKRASEKQYFEERCFFEMKEKEGLFIDAGSYDGSDSLKALEKCPKIGKVIALEPDLDNYNKCIDNTKQEENIEILKMGLMDENGMGMFDSGKDEKSRIVIDGEGIVDITTIDSLCKNEKVGIIKMDIEGTELKALEGGKEVIKRDKPGLIISIYHKEDDIFKIPSYILSINPDYHFHFGHYAVASASETVLYGV